jgi:hypothetical protein
LENAQDRQQATTEIKRSNTPRIPIWKKGQPETPPQPPTKTHEESPNDKAATSTARATWVIAFFTIILAAVGIFTLIEVIDGGNDTKKLAEAAATQAQAALLQSQSTESLATASNFQALAVSEQAERTKTIADQAVIQATAATSAAKTARDALTSGQRAFLTFAQDLQAAAITDEADQRTLHTLFIPY